MYFLWETKNNELSGSFNSLFYFPIRNTLGDSFVRKKASKSFQWRQALTLDFGRGIGFKSGQVVRCYIVMWKHLHMMTSFLIWLLIHISYFNNEMVKSAKRNTIRCQGNKQIKHPCLSAKLLNNGTIRVKTIRNTIVGGAAFNGHLIVATLISSSYLLKRCDEKVCISRQHAVQILRNNLYRSMNVFGIAPSLFFLMTFNSIINAIAIIF